MLIAQAFLASCMVGSISASAQRHQFPRLCQRPTKHQVQLSTSREAAKAQQQSIAVQQAAAPRRAVETPAAQGLPEVTDAATPIVDRLARLCSDTPEQDVATEDAACASRPHANTVAASCASGMSAMGQWSISNRDTLRRHAHGCGFCHIGSIPRYDQQHKLCFSSKAIVADAAESSATSLIRNSSVHSSVAPKRSRLHDDSHVVGIMHRDVAAAAVASPLAENRSTVFRAEMASCELAQEQTPLPMDGQVTCQDAKRRRLMFS